MNTISSNRYLISNIDELETAIERRTGRNSSVEITPISGATVSGEALLVGTEDEKLYFAAFSDVRVRGIVSDTFLTFGLFLHSGGSNSLWNSQLSTGDIGWVPPGLEHDAVYASNIQFALLMVRPDKFARLLARRGLSNLEHCARSTGLRHLPPMYSLVISEQFQAARSVILQDPDRMKSSGEFDPIFGLLLNEIIHALAHDLPTAKPQGQMAYASLVKKAEELLHEETNDISSINELCRQLKVSRRTLHRAFDNVIGMPPRLYLRNWRLSRVHHDLKQGRANSVTECAHRWGFSELGRFSGYYKDVFGALPSSTLEGNSGSQTGRPKIHRLRDEIGAN